VNSGTATYSTTSGTALTISGDITKSQVSDFTSGTVTTILGSITKSQVSDFTSGTVTSASTAQQAGTAVFSNTSGTATFATNASTAVSVSGSAITQSQVVNLVSDLANTAKLNTANAFTVGGHTIATGADANKGLTINSNGTAQSAALLDVVGTTAQTTITGAGLFTTTASVQTTGIRNPSVVTVLSFNTAGINVLNNNSTAANVGQVVRGASGQSANLQEWQNSGGTVLSRFSSSGQFVSDQQTFVGSGATSISNSRFNVATGSSSVIGQVIRGAASQSVDLLQLQNSAGTNQFRVDQGGMTVTNSLGVAGSPSGISYAYFTTPSASSVPVVVRGAASQTSNLQQWQISDTTVVARVLADGQFVSSAINTSNNFARMLEANSGGTLQLTRMTAQAGNAGANIGRIYLRDGTNAGTLKLVIRAGASGAETTILDNIPQT
jgi:hypothetical protein